jgi:hypothetical protein
LRVKKPIDNEKKKQMKRVRQSTPDAESDTEPTPEPTEFYWDESLQTHLPRALIDVIAEEWIEAPLDLLRSFLDPFIGKNIIWESIHCRRLNLLPQIAYITKSFREWSLEQLAVVMPSRRECMLVCLASQKFRYEEECFNTGETYLCIVDSASGLITAFTSLEALAPRQLWTRDYFKVDFLAAENLGSPYLYIARLTWMDTTLDCSESGNHELALFQLWRFNMVKKSTTMVGSFRIALNFYFSNGMIFHENENDGSCDLTLTPGSDDDHWPCRAGWPGDDHRWPPNEFHPLAGYFLRLTLKTKGDLVSVLSAPALTPFFLHDAISLPNPTTTRIEVGHLPYQLGTDTSPHDWWQTLRDSIFMIGDSENQVAYLADQYTHEQWTIPLVVKDDKPYHHEGERYCFVGTIGHLAIFTDENHFYGAPLGDPNPRGLIFLDYLPMGYSLKFPWAFSRDRRFAIQESDECAIIELTDFLSGCFISHRR